MQIDWQQVIVTVGSVLVAFIIYDKVVKKMLEPKPTEGE